MFHSTVENFNRPGGVGSFVCFLVKGNEVDDFDRWFSYEYKLNADCDKQKLVKFEFLQRGKQSLQQGKKMQISLNEYGDHGSGDFKEDIWTILLIA